MILKKFFIEMSFDNGATWDHITDWVHVDSVRVTMRAMSNSFGNAQNEASFSVMYDAALHAAIRSMTTDMLVRIWTGDDFNTNFSTLGGFTLGSHTLISSTLDRVFTGHIPPVFGRRYNGLDYMTDIDLNATDSFDLLDVEMGDVAYIYNASVVDSYNGPFQVCNPLNTTYSILHRVALLAGFSGSKISAPTISTIHTAVSADSESETVASFLEKFMYEHGYVIRMDKYDRMTFVKWIRDNSYTIAHVFDSDDVRDTYSESYSARQYNGVELQWNELGEKSNILLFRDSNLPYASDGSFLGYEIGPGIYYPPKTNAFDSNGDRYRVFQEYNDDGIMYATNRAIEDDLDINRHAVPSNYKETVATKNHWLEYSVSDPAIQFNPAPLTGNRKAELRLLNTGLVAADLYYLNVRGDVVYKKSTATMKAYEGSDAKKLHKYQASYIDTTTLASVWAKCRAAQFIYGRVVLNFSSDTNVEEGSRIQIQWPTETIDAIIMDRGIDQDIDGYVYTAMIYSFADVPIAVDTIAEISTPNDFVPPRVAKYIGKSATIPSELSLGDWFLATANINY